MATKSSTSQRATTRRRVSRVKLKDLKDAYAGAIERGVHSFFIEDDKEVVVGYAKYLIEYLESMGAKDTDDIRFSTRNINNI